MKFENNVTENLYKKYDDYKEKRIQNRRFKHKELVVFLEELKKGNNISITEEGKSVEGRSIFLVKCGSGKTKILLWSQMHGDEATATMALIDFLNFYNATDEFDDFRDYLRANLTLYIIPMLNPDGAEAFTRRNAVDIDLNRDALALASPESQLLRRIRAEVNPEFGFNLHDMDIRYGVGNTDKLATIAFLAPPVDYKETIDATREKAMKVIVSLNRLLEGYIPGQIGKWAAEYEPRAFGENTQQSGTSTILIESGGYPNDPEKQLIRKLNFILFIQAFKVIVEKSFEKEDLKEYDKIPFNSKTFFDLIIRNVFIEKSGRRYKADIGINRYEVNNEKGFHYKSLIEEIGDMRNFYGYEEYDTEGMVVSPGKLTEKDHDTRSITLDSPADLVLRKEGEVRGVVVNGFRYEGKGYC